jgi:flagellar hook-associated protein 2
MVGPISVNGPASGIDTSAIIAKLISLQTAPEQVYQNEISIARAQKNALLQLNVGLLAVKSATNQLQLPSLFSSTKLSSSNESVLSATSTGTVAPGDYTFSVSKLAQANQLISNGFPDSTSTPVAAAPGSLSIEVGGGFLDQATPVSFLNGQTGFSPGSIQITDTSGVTATVDLSAAKNVQDVVNSINSAPGVSVKASLAGQQIVLEDLAGGGGTLAVSNVGATQTATSLGIAGSGVAIGGNEYLFGSDINPVTSSTPLALLNGGLGVRMNANGQPDFTVSGGTGASAFSFGVALQSGDTTLGQVIADINAAGAASGVTASLEARGNALVLTSSAGGGLSITPTHGSFAAVDLGLGTISAASFIQNSVENSATGLQDAAGDRIVGSSLASSLDGLQRSLLNEGQNNLSPSEVKGISGGSITLTDRSGNTTTVNVSSSVYTTTAGDPSPGATSLTLGSVNGFAVGNQIRVQTSAGLEYRTVTALNASTDTVTLDQALLGQVAAGAGVVGINGSLGDIVRTLNQGAADGHVGIQVGLTPGEDVLQVNDVTGGTGTLSVSGKAASDLGIAGSSSQGSLLGASLHPQYLGDSTLLSSLNGGQGVADGRFQVTDTHGAQFTVALSPSASSTLGSLIQTINAAAASAGSGLIARLNDRRNGILLVDTNPGTGTLQVQDLAGGQTARELNLAGSAPASSPAQIDGSFQHTISIAAGSTLQSIANALNSAGIGVTASILDDGSTGNAFHLVLTSQSTGEVGRLTVDTTIPGLRFATSAAAQNAVVEYGGGAGATPVVVTSSTNTVAGIVPGMTLQLNGVSSSPVTISSTPDTSAITTQIQNFVNSYNSVLSQIQSVSSYDPTTQTAGVLFGNSALQGLTARLSSLITSPVAGIPEGQLNTLASIGISISQQGSLSLNQNVLSSALQNHFGQVESLFTQARKLTLSTPLSALNSGAGVTDTPGPDFTVTAMDGTSFNVDIGGAKTVEDLLLAIENAPGNNGKVTAAISSDGFSLELTDHTGGSAHPLQVVDIGNADAAAQLGIGTIAASGDNVLKGAILTLSGSPGIGAQMSSALNFITEAGDGTLAIQENALNTRITDLNKSISNLNAIAAQMQISLVRQFANLEAIIASSETTSQELQAILGTTTSNGTSTAPSLQSILGGNTASQSTNLTGSTSGSGGSSSGSSSSGSGSGGSSGSGGTGIG